VIVNIEFYVFLTLLSASLSYGILL